MIPRKGNIKSKDSTSKASSSLTHPSSSKQNSVDKYADGEYERRKHQFIRSTIRTDYQPDICKDYKETGFCGFGDSCKFLHDRSDYKAGWQIDQEYARGEYKDEEDDKYLIKDDHEDGDADDTANNCAICKEPYKSPILTKCKHQFCIDCAEKECNDKCFICEKPTHGIFKNAKR